LLAVERETGLAAFGLGRHWIMRPEPQGFPPPVSKRRKDKNQDLAPCISVMF